MDEQTPTPTPEPIEVEVNPEEAAIDQPAAQPESQAPEKQAKKKPSIPKPALIGIAIVIVFAIIAIIASSLICSHEDWADATCFEPKTCIECGKTEGEPLGHDWREATCALPETCPRCGETQGEPAGNHSWKDATCTEAKTCSVCGKEDGDPIGHTEGEWEYGTIDFSDAERSKTKECTVCGEVVASETETIDSFVENGKFLFSPEQFFDLFEAKLDLVSYLELYDDSDSDLIAYTMRDDGEKIGLVAFAIDGDNVGSSYASKGNQDYQIIVYIPDDANAEENAAYAIISLIRACDPSLDLDSAKEVGSKLLDYEEIVENGIKYIFYKDSDDNYWLEAVNA